MKKFIEFVVLWFAASITINVPVILGLQWHTFDIILSSAVVTALLMLVKSNRTKIIASSFYSVLMVINCFRDVDAPTAFMHIVAPAILSAICIGGVCYYINRKTL